VLFSQSDKFSLRIALTAHSFSRKVGRRVRSDSTDFYPKISMRTSWGGRRVVKAFIGQFVSF